MKDYDDYLERYCCSRGISKAEAEQHALVKEYKEYCKGKAERIEPTYTELQCGCGGIK